MYTYLSIHLCNQINLPFIHLISYKHAGANASHLQGVKIATELQGVKIAATDSLLVLILQLGFFSNKQHYLSVIAIIYYFVKPKNPSVLASKSKNSKKPHSFPNIKGFLETNKPAIEPYIYTKETSVIVAESQDSRKRHSFANS